MATINISLPTQLKGQADTLIAQGYFSSFSDLVRTALRSVLEGQYYSHLADEAVSEHRAGKTPILRTKKDIEKFLQKHMS